MRQAVAASANVELPPDFQYLTPEQQAQFQSSLSASGGPMFTLVFPALAALGRIWFGWLIVAAILHLTMTLFGGRATMGSMLNRAAWAGLPLGLQSLIRIGALLMHAAALIVSPGLSGFAPAGEGWLAALAGLVLGQIDVFMLWTVIAARARPAGAGRPRSFEGLDGGAHHHRPGTAAGGAPGAGRFALERVDDHSALHVLMSPLLVRSRASAARS